ncbi:hypothetical protein [Rossellomorea marisflavi]
MGMLIHMTLQKLKQQEVEKAAKAEESVKKAEKKPKPKARKSSAK